MTPQELLSRFMLALCVWREARGESLRGKMLVAQVITNRVLDARWPSTYVGVITQPKQFSAFNAGDPNATLFPAEDDPSWRDSVQAANSVLDGQVIGATEANHYCVSTLRPAWFDVNKVVTVEGHHTFLRL